MNIGDIVLCKKKKKAVLIDINQEEQWVTVVFLKSGMYKPEIFNIVDIEVIDENNKWSQTRLQRRFNSTQA